MYALPTSDLSDFTNDDGEVELSKLPELQHLFSAIDINRQMIPALLDPNNPFRVMMEEARARAEEAMHQLVYTEAYGAGASAAITKLQNEVKRHYDLIEWIKTYSKIGDEAAIQVRRIEEEAEALQ